MDEFWYYDAAGSVLRCPESRARQQLQSEAANVGRVRQLSEDDFHHGVRQLGDAYDEFLSATNNYKVEQESQLHWHNRFRTVRLSKKLGEPEITQEILSQAAYSYLKGPLRVPMLDRGLLDAFIAQETFTFIDRSAGRGAVQFHVGCFGVMMASSIVWAMLFGDSGVNWTRYGTVTGGLLLFFLVIWAWPKRGPYALYREMRGTYQALTGSVVSVPELRRRWSGLGIRGWSGQLSCTQC